MKKVTRAELLPLEVYESRRDAVRRRMIALKTRRRAVLPPHISVTFENNKTAWYQIQEMLRAERVVKGAAIRHELNTYNELVPGRGCLRATLFIEIPDLHKLKDRLARYVSLPVDGSLYIQLTPRGARPVNVRARFDPEQYSETRISAVQYITFEFPADALAALRARGTTLQLICDHPENRARIPIDGDLRREILADLRPDAPRRPSRRTSK